MRRLTLMLSTVLAAAIAFSVCAVAVGAEPATKAQYAKEGGAQQPRPPEPAPADDVPTPADEPVDPETAPAPASVQAAVEAVDEHPYFDVAEKPSAPAASGGARHSARHSARHGAGDGAKALSYTLTVPEDGAYSLYARWPVGKDNATAARFVVPTASGPESDVVNQRADAGFWVLIGVFRMEKGERTIRVESGGEGTAVLDAAMIVKDAVIAPNGDTASVADPEALAPVPGDQQTASRMSTTERAGSTSTRADIVRIARTHLGTPYGTRTCEKGVTEDCSCHTKLVFRRFGYNLPDSPAGQWRYGKRVSRPAMGDLVFHDLDNSGSLENNWDDHVEIYAGNGYVIHASSYFGKVVRSEMKYLPHYYGAKRLRIR